MAVAAMSNDDHSNKTHLSCDTVIIGAGTAGLEAYSAAVATGASCILIESGPLGTSARRTGDVPISALLEAGKKSHAIYELERYGVKANFEFSLDTEHVMNNLRAIRAKETSEILSFIYRIPENHRLIGRARFLDAYNVQVNESHIVNFKSAVIATGATPVVPYELSSFGVAGGVYTTNEFFDLDHLPNSMAIFGSNRDGLQIGQALSYLGVKVVVFGNHSLWELTDESVIEAAIHEYKERFELVLDCYITAIEKNDRGFEIYYLDSSNYENILFVETILSANVRYPKLEGLNLRELGLSLTRQGCISVDRLTMQCSLEHIFAAGDVTSLSMTNAKARHQGKIAGLNAANYPKLQRFSEPSQLNILFTDPELALVGLSYEEVKQRAKAGQTFVSSEIHMGDGRFRTTRHEGGILRLYCDEQSHQILGAEICCYQASHLAQMLNMAIAQHMTVEQVAALPFFTPSFEEVIHKACLEAMRYLERKRIGASE